MERLSRPARIWQLNRGSGLFLASDAMRDALHPEGASRSSFRRLSKAKAVTRWITGPLCLHGRRGNCWPVDCPICSRHARCTGQPGWCWRYLPSASEHQRPLEDWIGFHFLVAGVDPPVSVHRAQMVRDTAQTNVEEIFYYLVFINEAEVVI